MIVRSIGKSLLGKATPFQMFTACFFGAMLGFLPGIWQAPMTFALLLGAVAVLNTNLGLMALVTLGTKLLSFALVPVSHAVGAVLLDGPTSGLFGMMINAPVLALCGFEYYGVTGGLAVGAVVGAVLGFVVTRAVGKLRSTFLELSRSSEKFDTWCKKGSVKWTCWAVLGAKPNRATFEKLENKKVGKPVRILGVALVALAVTLVFVLPEFLSGPILTNLVRSELERMNGASVDLDHAELSLSEGRLVIEGLALVDADDLSRDAFRAGRIEADVSTADLLRKRVKLDRVVITDASTGAIRTAPGRRILPEVEPTPEAIAETRDPAGIQAESSETLGQLEDYVDEAKVWKDRLETANRWLGHLSGDGAAAADDDAPCDADAASGKTSPVADRAGDIASHLIQGAPSFLIGELRIERLEALQAGGKMLTVEGANLSTQPSLVEGAPRLGIRTEDGDVVFDLALGDAAANPTASTLELALRGISGDTVGAHLRSTGGPLIRGGTIDVVAAGDWRSTSPAHVDLPVRVTLMNTVLQIPGIDAPQQFERLELPLRVTGSLSSPGIQFENDALVDALMAAGREELARQFQQHVGAKIDAAKAQVEEKIDDAKQQLQAEADRAKLELEQKLAAEKAKVEAEKQRLADEAKKKAEAEAKKKLEEKSKGLLDGFGGGGLLGGGGGKD